jgi:hypothetical protein
MSGHRYRISKTDGKIEKDGEIIKLKFEGTILATLDPAALNHLTKSELKRFLARNQ